MTSDDELKDGFFYGLFMDPDVLARYEVEPRNPRMAFVDNYKLSIGQRATLTKAPGKRSWGMVYALTSKEFGKLYDAPGLEDYQAMRLVVSVIDEAELETDCYLLLKPESGLAKNHSYAEQLKKALLKLRFPPEYTDTF